MAVIAFGQCPHRVSPRPKFVAIGFITSDDSSSAERRVIAVPISTLAELVKTNASDKKLMVELAVQLQLYDEGVGFKSLAFDFRIPAAMPTSLRRHSNQPVTVYDEAAMAAERTAVKAAN